MTMLSLICDEISPSSGAVLVSPHLSLSCTFVMNKGKGECNEVGRGWAMGDRDILVSTHSHMYVSVLTYATI